MTVHTAELIPVTKFIENQTIPVRALDRRHEEIWHVRATPLDLQNENHSQQDWTLIRDGDIVRIPLCPYRTCNMDIATLSLVSVDLGQRLRARYPEAVRTHIIVGQPIVDLSPTVEALQLWLGFAVRIR